MLSPEADWYYVPPVIAFVRDTDIAIVDKAYCGYVTTE